MFVYTVKSDAGMYQCEVHNAELDLTESGSYSVVRLQQQPEGYSFPPRLLHKSDASVNALKGREASFECIYGGRYA